MSLDKAIKYKKERRKEYRGAKAVDSHCRNHGECPWCQGKIKYKAKKREPIVSDDDDSNINMEVPSHD